MDARRGKLPLEDSVYGRGVNQVLEKRLRSSVSVKKSEWFPGERLKILCVIITTHVRRSIALFLVLHLLVC